MTWRRRWRNNWENIRYCSQSCRQKGLTQTDRKLEAAILELLAKRGSKKTIMPEEAVAMVSDETNMNHTSSSLSAARNAARRLYNRGVVDILQRGQPVNPSTAKGPFDIRLRIRGE